MSDHLPDPAPTGGPPSRRVLLLPVISGALLGAFALLPSVGQSERAAASFEATAVALVGWGLSLWALAGRRRRTLRARFVLRRPHWLQPLVQLSVYAWWGWHWHQVAASAVFIVAQLFFAYAFDMLLAWSLGEDYELGLGPFPIILSINLFLWFKPDWFAWQFALIAVGFGAKRLLRWRRDGRLVHIFNPSSFPLAIASVVLIATGTADRTFGSAIASSLGSPGHIFEYLFLISLPGQLLFGVAAMTMPAVATAALLGGAYFLLTGSYFYFGTIPAAAFLGMLLLFTDPSTAPRRELGRVIFGVLYGASVFVLYGTLERFGQQTFYDKLLFVPVLNLAVPLIDRLSAAPLLSRLDPGLLLRRLSGRPRNLAWTTGWAVVFALLLAVHSVGDTHPANRLPFWEQACGRGARNGCKNLLTMETAFCDQGSGWACNEVGLRAAAGSLSVKQVAEVQAYSFGQACKLGFDAGCANLRGAQGRSGGLRHAAPRTADYELMIDRKGAAPPRTSGEVLHLACAQGWLSACGSDAAAAGAPARQVVAACDAGDREACRSVGLPYRRGEGVARDDRRAMACDLGLAAICLTGLR